MAKGSNANSDLYKKLHEEYGLEINVDFYLHPQSGSYIIKHNAVKKLVAKQREKGFIIETPTGEDIIIINDGTREGIHGKEVVVAGNFYLKNSDGVVIEKVYRTGEVNQKNCKNFYPHAMAEKRLYDRGVLDLLRFAQEGLYSDIEMDEFRQSAPPKPKPVQESKPVAPLPPPPSSMPKISAPEKKTPKVIPESNVEFKIMNIMIENTEGTSKSEIWNMLPYDKDQINIAIDKLLSQGRIVKTGERRGTKYHAKENVSAQEEPEAPLTQVQYNELWRDTSEQLIKKGIEYQSLMTLVHEVTGHESAIKAFKSGSLTKEHIEEIKRIGMLKATNRVS
jgi:hypothetical protein